MKRYFFLFVAVATTLLCAAQSVNQDYLDYIARYRNAALQQQVRHHIPASITLAQGLLESGAGKSTLATVANNHFGIKCHSDWKGETFTHDDETKNECFRSYKNAAQSFEDHSAFLLRPRYASLFTLSLDDYQGWASGLRECGYATDPAYAAKLIKIIETYDLAAVVADSLNVDVDADVNVNVNVNENENKAKTDKKKGEKKGDIELEPEPETGKKAKRVPFQAIDLGRNHRVFRQGLQRWIVAEAGDTYEGIAAEFQISLRRLYRYNKVSYQTQQPIERQRVYLTRHK